MISGISNGDKIDPAPLGEQVEYATPADSGDESVESGGFVKIAEASDNV